MKYIFFLIVLFFLVQTRIAHAYLDPGIISIIFQGILAFFAATIATITIYWRKIKDIVRRIFCKKNKNEEREKN